MNSVQIANVERYNQHVDDFNIHVNDFSDRCSGRSYLAADKSAADAQIEMQRPALENEGRNRVD